MAHTQAELEALKNSLLASNQEGKITAIKHRQFEQALINELFDPESRGNLLALIQTVLNLNPGDKALVITNGVLRAIDVANLATSGAARAYKGRFSTDEALLLAYPNDDEDATLGDYAQVGETNSYWERDSTTLEWYDTGDVIDDLELDLFPTLGNTDRGATSDGIAQRLNQKAETVHTHSESEAWLSAIISNLVNEADLLALVNDLLLAGAGINIAIVGGKIRITNTGDGGTGAGDFADLGGDPYDNAALATALSNKLGFRTGINKPWAASIALDGGAEPNEVFNTTDATGDFAVTLATTRTGYVLFQYIIKLTGISSLQLSLPATVKDHRERDIVGNVITISGAIGDAVTIWFEKRGSNWSLWQEEPPSEGTLDYEELTNKPQINGVELSGNKTTADLNISYNDLDDLPTIPDEVTAASLGTLVNGTTAKATPADADIFAIFDSVASWITKKITWANIKSELSSIFVSKSGWVTAAPSGGVVTIALNDENLKYKSTLTGDYTYEVGTIADGSNTIHKINTGAVGTAIVMTFDTSYTHKSLNSTVTSYSLPAGAGKEYFVTFIVEGTTIEVSVVDGTGSAVITYASTAEINTGTEAAKSIAPDQLEASKYLTQSGAKLSATASGTDTYTASIAPAITAYSNTQRFYIKFTNANTGAATINLNSLGAKSIVKNGGTALAAGDIAANQIHCLAYDGTNMQIVGGVGSGGGGGSGTVTSVAMTVPTGFAVSGSPITTSGTIAVTENTQNANLVKAGPSSGAAAAPTYRALVTNDFPDDGVTNAKLANMGANTVKGNNTDSSADPSDVPLILMDDVMYGTQYCKTSSSTSLTMDLTGRVWVFTGGSAATWTLPAVSGNTNIHYKVYNRGSANVVVQRAGSDNLYDGASGSVTSKTITPGQVFDFNNDGIYWLIS